MALHANYNGIKDWEELVYDGDKLNPTTHAIVFMTMAIGMGSITNKNVDEFIMRVMLEQEMSGPWLYEMKGDERVGVYVTPNDVRRHTGLTTNVSRMTRVQYRKRVYDMLVGRAEDLGTRLDREDKDSDEEAA